MRKINLFFHLQTPSSSFFSETFNTPTPLKCIYTLNFLFLFQCSLTLPTFHWLLFSFFPSHYLLLSPFLLFGGLYARFKELWSLDCGMASFLLSLSLENPPRPPGSGLGGFQAALAFWYTSQLSLLIWKVALWSDNPCIPLLYFQSASWREPGKGELEPLPELRAPACLRIALAFAEEFEHCIKHSIPILPEPYSSLCTSFQTTYSLSPHRNPSSQWETKWVCCMNY